MAHDAVDVNCVFRGISPLFGRGASIHQHADEPFSKRTARAFNFLIDERNITAGGLKTELGFISNESSKCSRAS
jgi:hypothetical protein